MRRALALLAMCATAMAFAAGCSRPEGAKTASEGVSGSIQIKGSDTMVNLTQALAEKYMAANPGASVAVTGGGSGTGIAAMINGTTDIAESSRAIKEKELEAATANGISPKEFLVGYDGLAVVVHPDNPVSELTLSQLKAIFTGASSNWKEFGGPDAGIVILSREVNSGTHVYFKEHVLNDGDSKGTEEFARSALLMPSSQAIADETAKNKNAIGYYGMAYISDKQKAVKIMNENGEAVEPTLENVVAKKYPVSRPLFMYTRSEPAGVAKSFMDFVFSEEGQNIVKELGFVPVNM